MLLKELHKNGVKPIHGKKSFPIGTTCRLYKNNKNFYFLADSEISKEGKPINVSESNISESLIGLWENLSTIGCIKPISIPLILTGHTGLSTSRQDMAKEIIFFCIIYRKF